MHELLLLLLLLLLQHGLLHQEAEIRSSRARCGRSRQHFRDLRRVGAGPLGRRPGEERGVAVQRALQGALQARDGRGR